MAKIKKIKDLFWRHEETRPEDLAPASVGDLDPLTFPVTPPLPTPADVDSEFYRAIEKELAKTTPAEFAEFHNQMSVINEKFTNLDETTRFQLAFHAAQTALKARSHSLTPAALVKSITEIEKTLESEKREFNAQNDHGYQANQAAVQQKVQQMSQGIKDREARLQTLQKEIDSFLSAKSAEKKKLEDERAQLISQRVVAEGEINQLQQKKNERETQFHAALEAHRRRLVELKAKLSEHLANIK
ncbi:MAG TPA: hypothetical protein PKW76_10990 [bacterium]|nr:hypothetical protein [bacterium]HPG46198.1 hypothetical protein [bacterium]HPM98174.1 hypothetical protein [bacterium]